MRTIGGDTYPLPNPPSFPQTGHRKSMKQRPHASPLSTKIKFSDMVVVQKIRRLSCQSDPACLQRIGSIRNF